MPDLDYFSLPVAPDEGFPQAFRLAFNSTIYVILLYVNAPETEVLALPADGFLDLLTPRAAGDTRRGFMAMRVARESAAGSEVIFWRRLVLNQVAPAAELAFRFNQIHIARGNLNGVGSFGSQVEGFVAAR